MRGPFRFTRNPTYLGMELVLIGTALLLASLTPWLVALAFPFLITAHFVRTEERMLRERFGAEYEAYCRRVGRWL